MRVGERAQSAPLGVLLLVVMTIIGAATVLAVGGAALEDVTESSDAQHVEQSMTRLGSGAQQVALSGPAARRINLGASRGTYTVDPTAGQISILQLDCDDDGVNQDGDAIAGGGDGDPLTTDDDAYILAPTSLGAVTYQHNGRTVAYQGGGVWRQDSTGETRMIAPPPVHHRGATLTFPVVLTRGTDGASGDVTAMVTASAAPTTTFTDPSKAFPDRCWEDGTAEPFSNPVTDGRVVVRIESAYARAWGRHFEHRSEGNVSYPAPDVVQVELASTDTVGSFRMPSEGESVTVPEATSHATKGFTVRLRPDDPDATTFDDLEWSMYAEEGTTQLELHLGKGASGGCPSPGVTADATVYYSDDSGSTYHGWHVDDAFDANCADLNGDGDEEIYLDVAFADDEDGDGDFTELEADDPRLKYESLGVGGTMVFTPGGSLVSSPTFSGHGDWESETYAAGDTESLDRLVTHYFAELPAEFELTVEDASTDSVAETSSDGELHVDGDDGGAIYLHVVKSEVSVRLEA